MEAVCLRLESLENPIGIDEVQPRFSWQVQADGFAAHQSAYQIQVADEHGDVWDSGKIDSDLSHHIRYAGEALSPLTRYQWQVKIWDAAGNESEWARAEFVTAVYENHEWQADWIHYPLVNMLPSEYVRRSFKINKEIKSAFLVMTAKGVFDPYLNGQRICDDYLSPGWTDYFKRQHYRVYDVKEHLGQGEQYLGAIVAEGWYAGQVGSHRPNIYSNLTYLLAELHITYSDGSTEQIVTDDKWEMSHGAYLQASIMHGEHYDARLELTDWCKGGEKGNWKPVTVKSFKDAQERTWDRNEPVALSTNLRAHPGVPVRAIETFQAKKVHEAEAGAYIYDFEQNLAGVVRLHLDLPAGTCLRLRHAEMITPEGSMYVENLRSAVATDIYICKGGGEIYDPRFTFHGFRYVEISGINQPLDLDKVEVVALGSDTPDAGTFSCSNDMLNQLQSNIRWTQRANFLEIPTDCPQRDERLGWTGDAQVFISTACANADVESFFRKWLNDMEDSQREDGTLPNVIPATPMGGNADAAWGDAITVCPTDLYTAYGDPELLADWYPRMKAFCEYYQLNIQEDGTRGGTFCFGDWLALDVEDFTQCGGGTPKDLIQTAFYNWSFRLTAQAARHAGKEDEAKDLEERAAKAAAAFDKKYFDADGKSHCDTQTSYVLALHFELIPEEKRQAAVKHLVDNIHRHDDHITTGFVGVSYLLPTLAKYGELDIAYKLLENKTFPSWGYSIENGATTIWERWNGWVKDVGPGDPNMNSYSHYAYGSVGAFMYGTLAGLKPLEPGFKKASLAPYPGGTITQAAYTYDSIVGQWQIDWVQKDEAFDCAFSIPANTSALVSLPVASPEQIQINGQALSEHQGISNIAVVDGRVQFDAQSGSYETHAALALSAQA